MHSTTALTSVLSSRKSVKRQVPSGIVVYLPRYVLCYFVFWSSAYRHSYLAQVMDFSAAQRKAFVDEYTDLCMSLITGLDRMSEETQTEARQNIRREAEEFAVGCKIHWQRSIIRLTRNGALVPRSLVSSFEHLTRVLSSDDTSLEAFDQAVIELREGFPAVARWLDWWLQPWVASMIFPAKSSVDPSLRDHIPRTSNPVEAKHSVLHRASGTDKALIPGLEGIFLYVNEIEALYNAVLGNYHRLYHVLLRVIALIKCTTSGALSATDYTTQFAQAHPIMEPE